MKILFCDWLHWCFPKPNHSLRIYLQSKGVECKYIQPCKISHNSRDFLVEIPEQQPKSHYRGFVLDSLIKTESTMKAGWYDVPLSLKIKYRKWVRYLIDWAFETFEQEKPDYIVIEGGLTYLSRSILEVAREMGIGIIALENSFIKDKIFIEFNTGYIVNRHTFARTSQDWLDTRYLSETQEKETLKIIENVFDNLNYKSLGKLNVKQFTDKKKLFVPLQVYADQVTLYDSPFNNEQFIDLILNLSKTVFKNWEVILKCHPKEERNKPKATGNWLQKLNLPNNVKVFRGAEKSINTQSLMKMADLIMVNNSQAGLEACLMGKPVVVCGDAFYGKKGFTIDYHENFDWNKIENNYQDYVNLPKCHLWFHYFYKWLYNKNLTESDKRRIDKELNL